MDSPSESTPSPAVVKLKPIEATPETFKDFGQVIEPSPIGEKIGPQAQLDIGQGIPRFYIMNLRGCTRKFESITHHASVTQCLGSIGGHVWYLVVSKSTIVDSNGPNVLQSRSGHFYLPPAEDDIRVFRISGSKFLKLNKGTWHDGPLFAPESMDFYILELSNTNVVDNTAHHFKKDGVVFEFDE